MKKLSSVALLVLTLACSTTEANLPGSAMVDSIERRLAADPCIGGMDRWFRKYAFGRGQEETGSDTGTIWFSLHEAGQFEFEAGRAIVSPDEFITMIDDRSYLYASGTYTIATDRLEIAFCGRNM